MRLVVSSSLFALLVLLVRADLGAAAEQWAYVVTSDYSTGGLSAVNLDTRAVSKDVAVVHSDATLRYYNGRIYVVNRFGQDNIQVIDPASAYATLLQFSTGNGSNPQDIVITSPTHAYVTRYERADLMVCNPSTGASLPSILLAAFADADGIPEMARMAVVGSRLFVAVQRLDRNAGFVPTAYSLVVVVDTQADTVLDVDPVLPGKQGIVLAGKNPVTTFAYDRATNHLLIGCAGRFGFLDGGVEVIDVATLQSLGYAITEAALGGDIGDLEWFTPTHSYAIVSDLSFDASLVSWNPTTAARLATVYAPGGFSLPDCALDDRGELYVGDNSFTTPGLYVFSAGADTLIAGPLDTGLPPNQIAFDQVRDEVASVTPSAPALTFSTPWPSPARAQARFALEVPRVAHVVVEAFDVAGRRVRMIEDGERPAGVLTLHWDLTDDEGRPVGPGIYFVRASIGGPALARRLVVLR